MQTENPVRAALLVLAAALLFACMGALVKHVAAVLPNTMVVFFRNALGLAALLPWLLRAGAGAWRTQHLRLHLVRSAAGLSAMYCFFWAIGHLHLVDAVLLNYSAPLFIPFIAAIWLREAVSTPLRWAAVIGFAGIALILKPTMGIFQRDALAGLAAAVFTAVAFVAIRRLSRTEPATRTVFYFSAFATVVSAVPLAWSWTTPPAALWGPLLLIGVTATVAQLLLTRAYAHAPAARVGPFGYSIVVFAALLGWWRWDERPGMHSLVGAVLVGIAGVLAVRRIGGRRADAEHSPQAGMATAADTDAPRQPVRSAARAAQVDPTDRDSRA